MKKVYLLFLLPAVMIAFGKNSFAQATNGTLPVLINISANLTDGNKVAVSWTILQKVNTDCFDVEKSNDGISWRSIATVKPCNDSAVPFTYNMIDASPLKGSNLYRIRIKDVNGLIGLTVIKNVRVNATGRMSMYPNPSANLVNISLGQVPRSDWYITIVNHLGQVVVQKRYSKSTTMVSLPVNNYPAGNYTVEIREGDSRQSNALMINHN